MKTFDWERHFVDGGNYTIYYADHKPSQTLRSVLNNPEIRKAWMRTIKSKNTLYQELKLEEKQ